MSVRLLADLMFALNDNLAASALPLIALPGISPRIVTGRKGAPSLSPNENGGARIWRRRFVVA